MSNAVSKPPPSDSTPILGVAGIILAMSIVALGNGLMYVYIPVRLNAESFAPTWAGWILTGLSAGGLAGCVLSAPLIRRVGHARAYMVSSALILLSHLAIAVGVDPALWIVARAVYGFGICALFVISQSWLNDAVSNDIRGRVMSIFYVAYIVCLGAGYYLLAFLDIMDGSIPLLCILFTTLSILPVGLTLLPQPPVPAGASIAIREAWRVSPVAVAGMLAVGALSMLISGFAPIHATDIGFDQQAVATLMFALPIGTVLLQIPLGWASDRTDRRYVIFAASAIVAIAGVFAWSFDGAALPILIAIYLVWSGASDAIYSLSTAHASDRASKDELVTLSGTLLFLWSVSGFIAPGVGTILTSYYGTGFFMPATIVVAAVFCLFVAWRIATTRAVPQAETVSFTPASSQAPPVLEPAEESSKSA
jgi:MFS family permease